MPTFMFDTEMIPTAVNIDDEMIRVTFSGGLEVATPTSRFPRLRQASQAQRLNWRIVGKGDGLHWPEIDEDISVRGLFRGIQPEPASAIEQVPYLVGELLKTTQRLNTLFKGRPFTPDGHLVGSIGEVVAEYIYDLALEPCSTPSVDAHTRDGRSVQIKLTGTKGASYGVRWTDRHPDAAPALLLCLKLEQDGFVEIYNGPFPLDLLRSKPEQRNGQVSLSVSSLRKANPRTLPKLKEFANTNRWFAPQWSNVA